MDEDTIARAKERLEEASEVRTDPATFDATLERARAAIEALTATTAELETGLPEVIQEGISRHFRPSTRHLAEVRGLMNQVIARLERIEGEVIAERHARIDDLALLVDLIAAGWKGVDDRLAHLEARLQGEGAVVYRLEDRQAG
jgi:hypothetical protein